MEHPHHSLEGDRENTSLPIDLADDDFDEDFFATIDKVVEQYNANKVVRSVSGGCTDTEHNSKLLPRVMM